MIAWVNTWVMQVTGWAGASSMVALMNTASAWTGTTALANKFNVIRMDFEGAVRYTLDWQTPTAAVGLMGIANTSVVVELTSLDKLVIIGAQKVNIALWRYWAH